MTERTMSPTAAQAHAKRIVRSRFKALRLGKRVEEPRILAGRLVAYAEDTAAAFPVEPSRAYREYIEVEFSDRFLRFCPDSPVPAKAGAR